MGRAREHIDGSGHQTRGLHLLFPGDEHSVRSALKTAMGAFRAMDIGEDLRVVIEIVLAEVLNNVVEHAYAAHGRGLIEVVVDRQESALAFRVLDDGSPLPDEQLPDGTPHDLEVAPDDLPEGGFGWFLIRELTESLSYCRSGNRNELSFCVPLGANVRPN